MGKWGMFALFALVLGLVSCSDGTSDGDEIWDFLNYTISMKVENAQGEDLLNPGQEGNITDHTIKALWGDKVFVRDADLSEAETRFNMPQWQGLYTREHQGRYYQSVAKNPFSMCLREEILRRKLL